MPLSRRRTGPRGAGFHRPCGTRTSVFDLEDRSYGGGLRRGRGWEELAWGGFLAELVSLIRDDLLDANVQEFEGRHVMAGDKDKEQTYRGPLSNGLFAFFQGAVGNPSFSASPAFNFFFFLSEKQLRSGVSYSLRFFF